ncbi:bacterioferritin-associated ferredoxin [Hydrocarboniphaga daqingensis]|uniref:Bacterioferritin-associated ferredoxin n=1 Tax=Hydrocarboniphaga daqingensis TaxID=490188 RepID=A0A1M5MNG0_9GAMM|nr:(2Fe-2S)-binding protein [Hydrocarboniphaga daqingensis]SHG78572.1 bacterioferritin-associated ferredoxin [Hydrocarboniphaga daqingensis]
MYVCVCKAVSDTRIKRMVCEGSATTLREVVRETGLGSCCGKCVPAARELLSSQRSSQPLRLADLGIAPGFAATA